MFKHLVSVRKYGGILNKYFSLIPVATKDGTFTIPHCEHGQHYHTLQGAKYESISLYVEQSQFFQKLHTLTDAAVLDVGLGLGYNALTTIETWRNHPAPNDIAMTSLEVDKELFLALISAKAPWQMNWPQDWLEWLSAIDEKKDFYELKLSHPANKALFTWTIYVVDGLDWIKNYTQQNKFNYIWQDPFTPDLNPRLWSAEFFSHLKKICDNDAILLSYCVARVVKDALKEAGWSYKVLRGKKLHKDWLKAGLIN